MCSLNIIKITVSQPRAYERDSKTAAQQSEAIIFLQGRVAALRVPVYKGELVKCCVNVNFVRLCPKLPPQKNHKLQASENRGNLLKNDRHDDWYSSPRLHEMLLAPSDSDRAA